MIDIFGATFNLATRTDATPAGLRPTSGASGFTTPGAASHTGGPASQDGGRAARLAYRLVSALGGMGR